MNIQYKTFLPSSEEADPRKKTILDEAIRTFAELGFRGADVQIIADRAGVGKGTVYRNLGTKEELFWASVAEVDNRLRAYVNKAIQNAPPEKAEDFLRIAAISYAEFHEQNPNYLEINILARSEFRGSIPQSHQEVYQQEFMMILGWLEEGIRRGELKDHDPMNIAFTFSALLDGVTSIYCYSDSLGWKPTMVEQMRFAVDRFLDGIRAESPK